MKRYDLFFLLLFFPFFSHAQNILTLKSSIPTDHNLTIQLQKQKIEHLQQRVNVLEAELIRYTKVKPVATVPTYTLSFQDPKKKRAQKGKKFIWKQRIPSQLSAYYTAAPQTLSEITENLEKQGFTVLAKDEILIHKIVVSFTNEALKKSSSFLSVLHLTSE